MCMINTEYQRQNLSSHLKQQKVRQLQDNRHWKIKGNFHWEKKKKTEDKL